MPTTDTTRHCSSGTCTHLRADTLADTLTALGIRERSAHLTRLHGSLTGNCVTRADTSTPTVIKHVRTNTQWLNDEISALEHLQDTPGVATLIGTDPTRHLIATRYEPPSTRPWTTRDITLALDTLRRMRENTTKLTLTPWGHRHDVGDDYSRGQAIALTRGPAALNALGNDGRAIANSVTRAYAYLAHPDNAETTTHCDTHPGNWLLTDTRPILIDMGTICTGPRGYDETYLIACWNAPTTTRIALLDATHTPPETARAVSVFIAALMAACHEDGSTWAAAHLPGVVTLAAALHAQASDTPR